MLPSETEQRVLDQLICHYYDTYPREAVGVVLRNGSVVRLRNWSRREDRFLSLGLKLIPTLGWKAWRHGRGISLSYHSHRESTRPSQIDEAFMRVLADRWPHVDHLIFTPDGQYDLWRVR